MKFIFNTQFSIFNSRNPLWEKYYSWTPYQYAACNPVSLMDGNGLFIKDKDGNTVIFKDNNQEFVKADNGNLNYLNAHGKAVSTEDAISGWNRIDIYNTFRTSNYSPSGNGNLDLRYSKGNISSLVSILINNRNVIGITK